MESQKNQLSVLGPQAMALYRAGRAREALGVCRQILAIDRTRADVLSFTGMIALELGEFAEAASCYEGAIKRKPDFAEAYYNLGVVLEKLGRADAAIKAYRRTVKLRPDLVEAHNNLGTVLESLGRFDEAVAAYRHAVAIMPDGAELQRNLGIVLHKTGKRDDAIAAFRRAIMLKPDWSSAHSNLANALLDGGPARETVAACDAWLAAIPGKIEAIVLKSLALNELGDREGARYLVDLDRFVQTIQFETPPAGYASMAAFNEALTRHALNHPTLRVPPETDPRYHVPSLRITDEFLAEPKGPAAPFEQMIDDAVAGYVRERAPRDPSHPYLVNPPRRWKITSWAAVLDRQGNLLPHVHFDGYVSGVYYPKLPDIVSALDRGKAGWLELGRPPAPHDSRSAPEIRTIQPREGLMVLFPSYFYHRTVPFEAAEPRISIAFDAVPIA